MNHRLLALTCASIVSGSVAPSTWAQTNSPTIYVVVDVGVNNMRAGRAAGGTSVTRVEDGTGLGLSGSRIGFRGTEDLGGGLSAGFVLESGILADTGTLAQGGRAYGRQSFVRLGHQSYGELRLGRQYLMGDTVTAIALPFGGAMVTKTSTSLSGAGITALPVWLDAARGDNVIQYTTPVFGGFYAGVQFAPSEGVHDAFHSIMGNYKNGPAAVALAYEWNKDRSTGAQTNKLTTIGGSYAFSGFKVGASLQRGEDLTLTSGNGNAAGFNFTLPATPTSQRFTATRFDGALASVEVPIGQFTLAAEWLQGRFRDDRGHAMKLVRPGIGASYALSKSTLLYAGFSTVTGDLKDYVNQQRIMNAGVRTAF